MTLQELLNEPERAFLPGPMQELNEDWAEKDALAQEQEERFEVARLKVMKIKSKRMSDILIARQALNRAVQDMDIIKPVVCEQCGEKKKLSGHHKSYAPEFRLSVNWLCYSCHSRITNAERKRGQW